MEKKMRLAMDKDYSIGKDAFEFFFELVGIFNHYSFFTKKLWKKVDGFKDKDEAEVKCAFMTMWAQRRLGIVTYPVGASWCTYDGSRELFDEYIKAWRPVFMAYMDWQYKSR